MRFVDLTWVIAVAGLAAAPAIAQTSSLSDRVSTLEEQATASRVNFEMLNKINDMQTQLRHLQGEVEQLQNENIQLKKFITDQYLDLDGRLNKLENGKKNLQDPLRSKSNNPPYNPSPVTRATVSPTTPASLPAQIHGQSSVNVASKTERADYEHAFQSIKSGQYADASEQFLKFLNQYPNSIYAPNVLYWLGESYYATRNYELAETQFQNLLNRYPTHDKAAGSLLKLGLCQYSQDDLHTAEKTFERVIAQFPGSDVARLARDELQAVRQERHTEHSNKSTD